MAPKCPCMPDPPFIAHHQRPRCPFLRGFYTLQAAQMYGSPFAEDENCLDAITYVQQAQRNAERPGDGDEAVPVTTDKSHEGKGAVSETKEQDRPVDTVLGHSSRCLIYLLHG